MVRRRAAIKITALFVIAFICLNAGGAMCIGYCQTFDITAEPEHCPLKKLSEHCDKTGETDHSYTSLVSGSEIDCCPMAVSFFAGPVEKKSFSFDSTAEAVAPGGDFSKPSFSLAKRFATNFNYRGPPLIDRRTDRIKNRIFRI
jgi:hypothetical protein